MTNTLKKTAKSSCVCADAMQALHKASREERLLAATEAMNQSLKMAALRFNGIHAALSICNEAIKSAGRDAVEFVEATKALRHGDYGLLLDSVIGDSDINHVMVEDAGMFADAVETLMKYTKVEKRMQACIDINKKIDNAISSWQSKINRMNLISTSRGSSEREYETAQEKIVQFNYAIQTLRRRGGQISDIFFNCKKQLEKFIADSQKEFVTIYENEKV